MEIKQQPESPGTSTYYMVRWHDDLTHKRFGILVETTRELYLPYHVYHLFIYGSEKDREKLLKNFEIRRISTDLMLVSLAVAPKSETANTFI